MTRAFSSPPHRRSRAGRAFAVVSLIFAGAGALIASPASALERDYRLSAAESALSFSYVEDGEAKRGVFQRFDAVGRIDPQNPTSARLTLTIRTASVDLDDAFRSRFAQSVDWFHSKEHPEAVFQLDRLTPQPGGGYRAEGELRIKGVSKRISAPTRLSFDQGSARARGEIAFDRRDFNVGGGPASLFVEIGDTISVNFDLKAVETR